MKSLGKGILISGMTWLKCIKQSPQKFLSPTLALLFLYWCKPLPSFSFTCFQIQIQWKAYLSLSWPSRFFLHIGCDPSCTHPWATYCGECRALVSQAQSMLPTLTHMDWACARSVFQKKKRRTLWKGLTEVQRV